MSYALHFFCLLLSSLDNIKQFYCKIKLQGAEPLNRSDDFRLNSGCLLSKTLWACFSMLRAPVSVVLANRLL